MLYCLNNRRPHSYPRESRGGPDRHTWKGRRVNAESRRADAWTGRPAPPSALPLVSGQRLPVSLGLWNPRTRPHPSSRARHNSSSLNSGPWSKKISEEHQSLLSEISVRSPFFGNGEWVGEPQPHPLGARAGREPRTHGSYPNPSHLSVIHAIVLLLTSSWQV